MNHCHQFESYSIRKEIKSPFRIGSTSYLMKSRTRVMNGSRDCATRCMNSDSLQPNILEMESGN